MILGPVGIGLVEAPAPKHTHVEGLRVHPGRRGDGLGLVGIDERSPEQAVIGVATAVAREGGVGTAVEQAYRKGEKAGETQATGSCMKRVSSHQESWVPPSRFLCLSRCVLGRPWPHFCLFPRDQY